MARVHIWFWARKLGLFHSSTSTAGAVVRLWDILPLEKRKTKLLHWDQPGDIQQPGWVLESNREPYKHTSGQRHCCVPRCSLMRYQTPEQKQSGFWGLTVCIGSTASSSAPSPFLYVHCSSPWVPLLILCSSYILKAAWPFTLYLFYSQKIPLYQMKPLTFPFESLFVTFNFASLSFGEMSVPG